jgi:hypothetical protein
VTRSRLVAALSAGAIAIGINTALLALADAVQFTTARGGLLRLVKTLLADIAAAIGLGSLWTEAIDPATSGPWFQTGFHLFVGLLMALFYAYVVEPLPPRAAWAKGVVYALWVWALNAFGVLPAIGQGIAGSASLGAPGMIGFAVIHTVFYVLLAVLYARFRRTPAEA